MLQEAISEALLLMFSISLFVDFIVAEVVAFIGVGSSIYLAPLIGTILTMLILVCSSFQVDGILVLVIGAIGTVVASIVIEIIS